MKTVIERVTKQCRAAALAGVPLLYIKTNYQEVVKAVAESDALVVRLCGSDAGPVLEGRPFSELPDTRGKRPKNWVQDKNSLSANYKLWKEPRLITIQAPGEEELRAGAWDFKGIEAYVRDFRDPDSSNYQVLRSSVLILYGEAGVLPKRLLPFTEFIGVGYPDRDEIRSLIEGEAKKHGEYLENEEQVGSLCSEFSGFTAYEVETTVRRIIGRDTAEGESPFQNTAMVRRIIREHKQQKMQSSSVLELIAMEEDEEIGGMGAFVRWMDAIAEKQVLEQADILRRRDGIQPPKGVLLCGIPGCGKSLAARAAAKTFRLPLIKMDVGRLMDKFQGESERNMREALALAEAMAPCVLWIDELEKGFSGASGDSGDSAAFKRMFGTLLGWMQDNKKPCFIFATANDIGGLPKEFFRSGRFDELFAVYLPTAKECADVFLARVRAAQENTRQEREKKGLLPLFSPECLEGREMYLPVVDSFVTAQGLPRILIGADIQKIVNQAQLLLLERYGTGEGRRRDLPITPEELLKALREAAGSCSVYGDGGENIDSIAVSYCRMLRKGMRPTADQELFKSSDYRPERLKKTDGESQGKVMEEGLEPKDLSPYDRAVYRILRDKINELAPEIEKMEKMKLIRG